MRDRDFGEGGGANKKGVSEELLIDMLYAA